MSRARLRELWALQVLRLSPSLNNGRDAHVPLRRVADPFHAEHHPLSRGVPCHRSGAFGSGLWKDIASSIQIFVMRL